MKSRRITALLLVLTMMLAIIPVASQATVTAISATTMQVTGGWLRLRSAASFAATTIKSYYTGTLVTADYYENGFYHVSLADGNQGFMYAPYLTTNITSDTGTVITSGTYAYIVNTSGRSVNLRTGPSTSYTVQGSYPVGTIVTVLSYGANWSYIRIGTTTGYMMTQFLSSYSGSSTLYGAYVTSPNQYGVRLRAAASTSATILGVYAAGTYVEVLQHGAVWDYIRIGSRTGYMMNQFLLGYSSVSVTAAAISSTSPKTGDKLSVSTTPAGATVSYKWYWVNNVGKKTLRSTSSVYAVSDADVGYGLCVEVTGTGSYTGSATSAVTSAVIEAPQLTGVTISGKTKPGAVLTATLSPKKGTATYKWYAGKTFRAETSDGTYTVQDIDVGKKITVEAYGTGDYSNSDMVSDTTANKVTMSGKTNATMTGSISLSGTKSGDSLTATCILSDLKPSNASYLSFKWSYTKKSNGKVSRKTVEGSNTFTFSSVENGDYVMCEVTPLDDSGYDTGTTISTTETYYVKNGALVTTYGTDYISDSDIKIKITQALSADGKTVTLTANVSGVPDGKHISAYQWKKDGDTISGAVGKTYEVKLSTAQSHSFSVGIKLASD